MAVVCPLATVPNCSCCFSAALSQLVYCVCSVASADKLLLAAASSGAISAGICRSRVSRLSFIASG